MEENSLALRLFTPEIMGIRCSISETGLTIPDGVEYETVERMFCGIKQINDSTGWWIGDMLVYSQRNYGEKYSQLLDAGDWAYSTLAAFHWTASNVAPHIRRKELSFSHHKEVAKLEEAEQAKYLELAVRDNLSVAQLRKVIKGGSNVVDKESKVETFETALKAILRIAKENSPDDTDQLSEENPLIAIIKIASGAISAFEK
jgi:hypothetical protein